MSAARRRMPFPCKPKSRAWRTCFPKPASSRPSAGPAQADLTKADKETRRLRAGLERAENQKTTIESLRAERGELRKEVTRLKREVARLGKRLVREEQASERHKETIRRQYDEDIQLRATLKRLRDQSDRVRSLSDEVFWLRLALDGVKTGREALKARLVKLRAVGGDAVETAVRRGRSTACGSEKIAAPEDDDQRAEQGEWPTA